MNSVLSAGNSYGSDETTFAFRREAVRRYTEFISPINGKCLFAHAERVDVIGE